MSQPGGSPMDETVSLTDRQRRVLQLLPSHLTFAEIGEILQLPADAVRRSAIAIYRRLDVASRHEAVERALVLRLISA